MEGIPRSRPAICIQFTRSQDVGTGSVASVPTPWCCPPVVQRVSPVSSMQHQRSFIGALLARGQATRVRGVRGTSPSGQRGPALRWGGLSSSLPPPPAAWLGGAGGNEPAGPGAQSGARLTQGEGSHPPLAGVIDRAVVLGRLVAMGGASARSARRVTSACGTWRPSGPPQSARRAARD